MKTKTKALLSLSNITTAAIVAATMGGTVMGANKIIKTIAITQKQPLPTLTTTAPTPSPTTQPTTPTSTPNPTNNQPTPTPQPQPNNKCLITVDGRLYDVTKLRSTHSGGDIFQCNTDMSAIFHSQHGYDLSRLAPYQVSSQPSSSSQSAPTPSPMPPASPLSQLPQYDDDIDKLTDNESHESSEHHSQDDNQTSHQEKEKSEDTHQENHQEKEHNTNQSQDNHQENHQEEIDD